MSSDRLANLVFTVCCLSLVGVAVERHRAPVREVMAREGFLKTGGADPFGLPASIDGGPLAAVFVSANCPACTDSLPFYKRLVDGVARTRGRAGVVFVTMDPPGDVTAYLRTAGIVNVRLESIGRPSGIPGTPCILMLDKAGRVQRSWAGRLSPRQEHDVEALLK